MCPASDFIDLMKRILGVWSDLIKDVLFRICQIIPHARNGGMLTSSESALTHLMPSSALVAFTPIDEQTRDSRVVFDSWMLWCTGTRSSYIGRNAVWQERRTEHPATLVRH